MSVPPTFTHVRTIASTLEVPTAAPVGMVIALTPTSGAVFQVF